MTKPRLAALGSFALLSIACEGSDASSDVDETGGATSAGSVDPSSTADDGGTGGDDSISTSSASTSSAGSEAPGDDDSSDDGASTGGEACVDDHRVVAFLANWEECPTAAQLAQYSHVVIAFAVTYTYDPGGNICDESCAIQPPAGCNGSALPDLVAELHDAGIEVLISFGGAGMGGIWEGTCGEMTKCWDYCVDQVESVADQLTGIVADNDLDGVDIDYEYCLNDASYVGFVEGLTNELRTRLDAAFPGDHKRITHAPMDSELEVGDPYYAIIEHVAPQLDFLMPQYYNGGQSPFTREGLASIHTHYGALVEGPFGGDPSRVVFGYCIEAGCAPVATQPEAVDVIEMFDAWYPGNGGIFFWAHPDDTDAWFSEPFRTYYDATACAP